jgi:tRNA/rRNA methyltransferase
VNKALLVGNGPKITEMTGKMTNQTQSVPPLAAPVVILSHPQMGENIGAAARSMRNFGLNEMWLIAPRDGWPNAKSTAMAAGAFAKMAPVRVFETIEEAVADLQQVYAVTARLRDMEKPVYSPDQAMKHIGVCLAEGGKAGLLFGAEASGLPNEEVANCNGIITYPVAMDFASLNLAQAVAVAAYAWQNCIQGPDLANLNPKPGVQEASRRELGGMLTQLRTELVRAGFFFPPEKEDLMMQNLQNMFGRGNLTSQEVQTFRGVIKALARGRGTDPR